MVGPADDVCAHTVINELNRMLDVGGGDAVGVVGFVFGGTFRLPRGRTSQVFASFHWFPDFQKPGNFETQKLVIIE